MSKPYAKFDTAEQYDAFVRLIRNEAIEDYSEMLKHASADKIGFTEAIELVKSSSEAATRRN